MKHNRLLITISFSFSIRYIVRTGLLRKLKQFCNPVIALTWNEPDLIKELQDEGFEVHLIPQNIKQPAYASVRKKIDIWFDHFQLKSSSKKYQSKYLDLFIPAKTKRIRNARRRYNVAKFYIPFYKKKVFEAEKQLVISDTNYETLSQFIDSLAIDAVFTVTPFHQQEDILLRVCKEKGKKMITSILSFDNITKRGWIPVLYDVYMVWNKYNEEELKSIYPSVKSASQIYITGAPQFDFYYDPSYLITKHEWLQQTGIKDLSKKIILYAGGPSTLFPDEPQYLKVLAEALQTGDISSDAIILFRCHPVDKIERWQSALSGCSNVYFETSWTGKDVLWNTNITDEDIRKLCSTLAYTDVHINVCSTMTVDGSAFHKPQIAPFYDDVNKKNETLMQNYYKQDHFMPIINTGGLSLAHSKAQLIELVNLALEKPEGFTQKSEKIVEEIITFTDGNATNRVAEILRQTMCRL